MTKVAASIERANIVFSLFLAKVSVIGPEVINIFSCHTQLNIKFILLIDVKMPKIVGILTFISRMNTYIRVLKQEISLF